MHTCVYVCIYLYVFICIYANICVYEYVYVYMWVCVYVYICGYISIYMYIFMCTHMYVAYLLTCKAVGHIELSWCTDSSLVVKFHRCSLPCVWRNSTDLWNRVAICSSVSVWDLQINQNISFKAASKKRRQIYLIWSFLKQRGGGFSICFIFFSTKGNLSFNFITSC